MTGAYLFATRDGKRKPVEVEFLTTEERKEKLGGRTPEELLGWIECCCTALRAASEFVVFTFPQDSPKEEKGEP